ncbi:MAG: Ig-like domain-containing protein, partial [Solirubrobacteraceae bacterium]
STRTLLSPPQAPQDLAAAANQPDKLVELSWQAAPGGVTAVAYRVFRGVTTDTSTFGALSPDTTGLTFADRPFQSATFYYQVAGVNSDDVVGVRSSTASATLDVNPPGTIGDLRITGSNPSAGTASLAWTAPSDDFSGVARYLLFQSTNDSFTSATSSVAVAAQAPGSTVAYTASVTSATATWFQVAAQDGAGNVSFPSPVVLFDPVPPVLASVSLADGQTLGRPLIVNVQATDNVAVASLTFAVDGAFVSSAAASSYGFFWDTRLLDDGAHSVTISAHDTSSNVSAVTLNETINYQPPSPPVITAPGQGFTTKVATVDVSGTADPGVGIQLLADNLDLDSATATGGVWSLPGETLPQEGPVSLTAVAFESRGFSAPSAAVNIRTFARE